MNLQISRVLKFNLGLPWWLSGKEPACRRRGFDPWVMTIPWRRKWQPTPVFLPGKPRGQRSLVGYSPQGYTESDMTEVTKQQQQNLTYSFYELKKEIHSITQKVFIECYQSVSGTSHVQGVQQKSQAELFSVLDEFTVYWGSRHTECNQEIIYTCLTTF